MNMRYCRFENTANDLRQCVDTWDDDDLSKDEQRGRARILEMARQLVRDYGDQE